MKANPKTPAPRALQTKLAMTSNVLFSPSRFFCQKWTKSLLKFYLQRKSFPKKRVVFKHQKREKVGACASNLRRISFFINVQGKKKVDQDVPGHLGFAVFCSFQANHLCLVCHFAGLTVCCLFTVQQPVHVRSGCLSETSIFVDGNSYSKADRWARSSVRLERRTLNP